MTALMASSCTGNGASDGHASDDHAPDTIAAVDTVGLPADVKEVVMAVATDDPERFAATVSYPLERPYPLRDVDDAAHMKEYYPVMVDDSLRSVITSAPASDWGGVGWRGWTLRNGEYMWIDGKLYVVNYVSPREREMIDSLSREEINSLQPELRKGGWRPAFCLRADGSDMLFRIDERGDSLAADRPYRLAVYRGGETIKGRPAAVMHGVMTIEGSAGVRTFMFEGCDGSQAVYEPDILSEDDMPRINIISASGKSEVYPVKRVYWRDFLHGKHPRKVAK